MEAPAIRQRMTLSDQLSVLQTSSNLRDLLKFREDDATARRANGTRTLATVLEAEKNDAASSSSSSSSTAAAAAARGGGGGGGGGRTLLDVIREEEEESRAGGGSSRWRDLTDRLRIRPGAATWTAGSAFTPARERPEQSGADRATEPGTMRVSLMTLMELRGREEEGEDERGRAALMAVAEADGDDAGVADEDEDEELVVGRGERHVCCVCMVRKKGAAFIPCGHTFCRVCSRELLMGRGNCPLCNATILEVLDIF